MLSLGILKCSLLLEGVRWWFNIDKEEVEQSQLHDEINEIMWRRCFKWTCTFPFATSTHLNIHAEPFNIWCKYFLCRCSTSQLPIWHRYRQWRKWAETTENGSKRLKTGLSVIFLLFFNFISHFFYFYLGFINRIYYIWIANDENGPKRPKTGPNDQKWVCQSFFFIFFTLYLIFFTFT